MGTGTKIALGCGCAALLATAAAVGVVGMGAWWAKGKIKETRAGIDKMTAESEETERYQQQADANPYAPAADGVVGEPRLLKFIDVRKQVYAVYERYEAQLKELEKKKDSANGKLTMSEVWSAGGALAEMAGEIRLAQMKGLASVGMSDSEYRDIQMAVTKAAWAFQSESKSGKLPAEQVSETMSEAAKQMGDAMRAGLDAAKKQGVPGSQTTSDADARKLQEEMQQAGKTAGESLHVPRANVELFRKHEADLKKYAMHGLAFLGL
jgi:hypothetical protein